MIIDILVLIVSILCILQASERRMTAMVFILLLASWSAMWPSQPENGTLYYSTGALFSVITLNIIVNLKNRTKLTERLSFVCYMFTLLNAIGWAMWMGGLSTAIYEYACISLYCFTIWSLLTWDGIEDGNYTMGGWVDLFRFNNSKCSHNI